MIDAGKVVDFYGRTMSEVSKVIVGKDDLKKILVVALLAGGHVLVEGFPGTGKTKIAKTFAAIMGCDFKRVQFTPDMLPADITGFYLYSPNGQSRLIEGPIVTNLLLADELNRATPRTQSALLEAMQEDQVTIERETYPLPSPFMVVATQQTAGAEGTYALTNVQSDRFLLRYLSGNASREEESSIIADIDRIDEPDLTPVTTADEVMAMRQTAKEVHVSPEIIEYIVSVLQAVRTDPDVDGVPGARGGIALFKASRAMALLDGRDFVIPDDVKTLVFAALEHRVSIRAESQMDEITPEIVLGRVLEAVAVPKVSVA